jgi:hypothetical protein
MDTKVDNAVIVDGKELAIGAHLQVQLGQTRGLDLSVAIPLGWSTDEVNNTLDRLVNAANRLKARQDLEATKSILLNAEQDLYNSRTKQAEQENQFMLDFASSNRRGDWKPTGGQQKIIDNFSAFEKQTSERIAKLKKDIVELEEKCR